MQSPERAALLRVHWLSTLSLRLNFGQGAFLQESFEAAALGGRKSERTSRLSNPVQTASNSIFGPRTWITTTSPRPSASALVGNCGLLRCSPIAPYKMGLLDERIFPIMGGIRDGVCKQTILSSVLGCTCGRRNLEAYQIGSRLLSRWYRLALFLDQHFNHDDDGELEPNEADSTHLSINKA